MESKLGINPWLTIWTRPRDTVKAIVASNPKYGFLILSAIYGFPCLLNVAQGMSLIEAWAIVPILLAALVFAVFVGMISITVTSLLISWTGKWLNGSASYLSVRAAVAWSNVPNAINVILWLAMIAYFGGSIFSSGFTRMPFTGTDQGIVMSVFLIQSVLAIWSLVILINGVAQVQGFSGWKALLNVALAFLIIFFIVWILAIIAS
jgi:hypothetical protein